MMNFLLGLVAGSLIAFIATIAAARHPEIQAHLGLVPAAQATLVEPPTRRDVRCVAPVRTDQLQATAAQADALFSRRRFWYVAP